MKRPDLIGEQFGRLKVIALSTEVSLAKVKFWLCQCECGRFKFVTTKHLRNGDVQSCGCLHREILSALGKANTKHGQSSSGNRRKPSPTYGSWVSMRSRCYNPNDPYYARYGGRGIKICDYWDTFKNFLEDMGQRPNGMTLDRINSDSHYMPSNCRWATAVEQAQNRGSR